MLRSNCLKKQSFEVNTIRQLHKMTKDLCNYRVTQLTSRVSQRNGRRNCELIVAGAVFVRL